MFALQQSAYAGLARQASTPNGAGNMMFAGSGVYPGNAMFPVVGMPPLVGMPAMMPQMAGRGGGNNDKRGDHATMTVRRAHSNPGSSGPASPYVA